MNPLMSAMSGKSNLVQLAMELKSGNADKVAAQLMQSNPNFRAFVEANRGKPFTQIAKEHGIDLSEIQKLL